MNIKRMCKAVISGFLIAGMLAPAVQPFNVNTEAYKGSIAVAEAASTLRRPCDPEHPMLIVHIDTWNVADPAKVIQAIPADIRPYCVFNISLSIYWDKNKKAWGLVQNGYECAKSWLKTCSDEGVWCMIQPASGGQCHFPDYDNNYNIVNSPNKSLFVQHADEDYENTIYAEFFRDYPGFIGFNYSEQFWGFDQADHPCTFQQRYQHFAHLLKLCNKYGGYLNINWCANQWSAPLNPIAMLKTNAQWREACEKYGQNLQLEEKYTQGSFIEDVESEVLGFYLAGYCGSYGVRYDETGWTDCDANGKVQFSKNYYRQITGMPIHMERMVLNGATIIDGPELVWQDDFRETGYNDGEGYRCRGWETKDIYYDSTRAFFRKVIDGTVCIPSRQEVIDRTQYVIIHDVNSGDDHKKYSTYETLFEGLYRMPGDGNLRNNNNLYKCTGRYPTIPTVYALRDSVAKSFKYQLKQSELPSRWNSISAKQNELNKVFPAIYSGSCYVANYNNSWVTYNPNKTGTNCGGVFDLKYNTCKSMDVNFNAFGNALITEYSDHIDIHTNNFDNKAQTTLKTDTFKINGCASKPSYTAKDTGRNQAKSEITENFSGGTYTLTVKHNGPVDITIKCSGNESNRQTNTPAKKVKAITQPAAYTGTRQYEGEFFDLKNCEGYVGNACGSGVNNVQGQGFLKFGKNGNAMAKDTVRTGRAGNFKLKLRYSNTSDINNVDLYVNNNKVTTLKLSNTNGYSNWKTVEQTISLKEGDNRIEFRANGGLSSSLYIDNFTVDGDFGAGTSQTIVVSEPEPVKPISGKLIKDLTVNDTENASDWSLYSDLNNGSVIYGDRDITVNGVPANLTNAETVRTACDSKLFTGELASFTAASDITVYAAVDTRVASGLDWLKNWKAAGTSLTASNDVELALYRTNAKAGEKVVLGTNGGNNESANYIVMAVPLEPDAPPVTTALPVTEPPVTSAPPVTSPAPAVTEPVITEPAVTAASPSPAEDVLLGDANCDGKVDLTDFSTFAISLVDKKPLEGKAKINADVNKDGTLDLTDLATIKQFLAKKISSF
ncbi:MAG: carbohydrate-binding protein [Oscillospiraceae bacterium]|nr:carbohydrate-binding protein [Oscillospiraceae bacterium]